MRSVKYNDKETKRADRMLSAGLGAFLIILCALLVFAVWRLSALLSPVPVPEEGAVPEIRGEPDIVETAAAPQDVAVISPTAVSYPLPGAAFPAWGCFFGYRNATDGPVEVDGFTISLTDPATGRTVDRTDAATFAPKVLAPGETGYGVCFGLDAESGRYPAGGVSAAVDPVTSRADSVPSAPSAAEAHIAKDCPGSFEKGGRGILIRAVSPDGEEHGGIGAVCGILDSSGALAGVACNLEDGIVPGAGPGDITCAYSVIAPDMSIDRAAMLDPALYFSEDGER